MIVVDASAPLIVIGDVMSKSPPALAFSLAAESVWVYVPAGSVIKSAPARAFASVMAALNEHAPFESAQVPLPGAASCVSAVVFTLKPGPGVGLADGVLLGVFVDVLVEVAVNVAVAVGVFVTVLVGVGVNVLVGDGLAVGVVVGVFVFVEVGVPSKVFSTEPLSQLLLMDGSGRGK